MYVYIYIYIYIHIHTHVSYIYIYIHISAGPLGIAAPGKGCRIEPGEFTLLTGTVQINIPGIT